MRSLILTRPQPARIEIAARLRLWAHLWTSRRALARLDDHLLRDIGLDAASAEAEARRPFWKD